MTATQLCFVKDTFVDVGHFAYICMVSCRRCLRLYLSVCGFVFSLCVCVCCVRPFQPQEATWAEKPNPAGGSVAMPREDPAGYLAQAVRRAVSHIQDCFSPQQERGSSRRGSSCSPQAGGDGGFVAGPVATSCLGGAGRSVVFAESPLQASS